MPDRTAMTTLRIIVTAFKRKEKQFCGRNGLFLRSEKRPLIEMKYQVLDSI